jgi:carbonic anhydrase/acetyltransferase-like protein (isoleucine patch superfamily)
MRKIWYNAVLRADSAKVEIGEGTNVQDRAVIVTNSELHSDYPRGVSIGDNVTIGHGALLTACTLGDHVLIGQGAILQQGKAGVGIL